MRRREYPVPGFWERVDKSVEATGKYRAQICRECDFAASVLNESKGMNMSVLNMWKLCKTMGLSADYLLGLKE